MTKQISISRNLVPAAEGANLRAASDYAGIVLSVLCLIHCLALPFLIAFAPTLLRNLPGDEITHRVLAVVIALVGLMAFCSGYRVHRRRWVLAVFITGLALISFAAILGDERLTGTGEAAITVCGGLLLVTAHLVNHSFCRSCVKPSCSTACTPDGANIGHSSSANS